MINYKSKMLNHKNTTFTFVSNDTCLYNLNHTHKNDTCFYRIANDKLDLQILTIHSNRVTYCILNILDSSKYNYFL